MRNAENYQEVCTKKKGVKIMFAKCFQTYHEYYQVVDLQKLHQMRLMLVVAL